MESRKYLFCGVLLLLVSLLGAQEYYVDLTDGEARFFQRLAWQADENAARYEVVIEELIRDEAPLDESPAGSELLASEESPEGDEAFVADTTEDVEPVEIAEPVETVEPVEIAEPVEIVEPVKIAEPVEIVEPVKPPETAGTVESVKSANEERGTYTQVLRESTDAASIEVSLPPGIYRYRVTAYDFLNRPGAPSEWARLTILEALDPTVLDFSPRVFHVDGDGPWVLNLTGNNISPDAKVSLEYPEKNRVIVPREYTANESLTGAELVFDIKKLVPGSYEIYVENPGGLSTSAGTVEIGFFKPYDMFIGAAYTPLVPLYGDFGELEKKSIFPVGAAVRFGIFPIKKAYGHFGVELNAAWNYLASGSGEDEVSYHVAGGEINLLYQKWLSNRIMAFTIRAGGGVAVAADMLFPRAEMGASFLWLIHKPFYMEIGVDGMHWFTGGNPGYLRPWLGAGLKL